MKSLYRIIIARAKGKVKPNTMSYIRGYAIQEKNGQIRSIRILLIFLGVASRERNRILRFFQAAEAVPTAPAAQRVPSQPIRGCTARQNRSAIPSQAESFTGILTAMTILHTAGSQRTASRHTAIRPASRSPDNQTRFFSRCAHMTARSALPRSRSRSSSRGSAHLWRETTRTAMHIHRTSSGHHPSYPASSRSSL